MRRLRSIPFTQCSACAVKPSWSTLAEGICLLALCLQHEMAQGGYRTLLIADKEMSLDYYEQWQATYAAACVSTLTRQPHIVARAGLWLPTGLLPASAHMPATKCAACMLAGNECDQPHCVHPTPSLQPWVAIFLVNHCRVLVEHVCHACAVAVHRCPWRTVRPRWRWSRTSLRRTCTWWVPRL